MKKKFIKIATAGLVLASSIGLSACSLDDELKYSFYNYDNTYAINEEFSLAGAKLKIENRDGTVTEITISDDMIKSMPDMTTAGTKTIVVIYDGNEYELKIEVLMPSVLSYNFYGYEEEYDINSTFDISSLLLSIDFDGTGDMLLPITANMITQMPDMSVEGRKEVSVSYNGKSYSFSFMVKDYAKADMLKKIRDFMKDYNSSEVKSSGIKINIEGTAKYLEDNVEFNEKITNLALSTVQNLEGYQIGKIDNSYVFVKNFETMEDLNKEWCMINLFNTDYIVVLQCENNHYSDSYGSITMEEFEAKMQYSELVEITMEEFKDGLQIINSYDAKEITIFNSKLAQPIYKAIINAVVNSTMDIQKSDIISAKDNLSAQLDILKTLQNINTNLTNIDFYDIFVNKMLLTESDLTYVELTRNFIAEMFEITDQETLDELDYVLTKDIKKIRNNQLQDLETTYDMIVELNEIIKASNGNPTTINQLDIIVSGIDKNDKHMLSKFVYSLKDFAVVQERVYGEHEDYDYILYSLDGTIYNSYTRPENPYSIIYQYYTYREVDDSDELVDEYYAGLKSFVEKFENITDYKNVKTFAYDIISDMRAMDEVVQVLEENEYDGELMNFFITSSVRMAVQTYIDMYDAEMISDVLELLRNGMPSTSEVYEVLTNSMAPEFSIGDKITVSSSEASMEGIACGSIIMFNNPQPTTHRIIGIIEDNGQTYYICHADNAQSANPDNPGLAYWQEDAQYISYLIHSDYTLTEIKQTAKNIQVVAATDVVGVVEAVNEVFFTIPSNLVDALQDCADTIYLALGKSEIDYIKLIEDICDRLELEKDYYIEKYNAGELTIFADAFENYIGDVSNYDEIDQIYLKAIKSSCNYLDSLLVNGTNRTEFINEINNFVKALYDTYVEIGEDCAYEQMITDIIVRLTNTEQDFYSNFNSIVKEYRTTIKETTTAMLIDCFNLGENDTAKNELEHIINYHLTAYLKDSFEMGDLVGDMNNFIDKYCEEDVRAYSKSIAILATLLMNKDQNINYNELLGKLELPKEIKDIDFNKLINETLKDTETYDILDLKDVKVDYITNQEGNIVKEILTISLNAKYDILISSMDANVTLTIEINF